MQKAFIGGFVRWDVLAVVLTEDMVLLDQRLCWDRMFFSLEGEDRSVGWENPTEPLWFWVRRARIVVSLQFEVLSRF